LQFSLKKKSLAGIKTCVTENEGNGMEVWEKVQTCKLVNFIICTIIKLNKRNKANQSPVCCNSMSCKVGGSYGTLRASNFGSHGKFGPNFQKWLLSSKPIVQKMKGIIVVE
jgi:hypothetical protein